MNPTFSSLFQDDAQKITSLLENLRQRANTAVVPVYDLSSFNATAEILNEMMGFYSNGTRSRLVDALENCVNSSSNEEIPADHHDTVLFWSMNHTCDSLLQELDEAFSADLKKKIDLDLTILAKYEENMMDLFKNFNKSVNVPSCLRLRKNLLSTSASLQKSINLALNLTKAENFLWALSLAENITNSYTNHQFSDDLPEVLANTCNKFMHVFDLNAKDWLRAINAINNIGYAEYFIKTLKVDVIYSNQKLSMLSSLVLNHTADFLVQSETKRKLTEIFLSQQFKTSKEQLRDQIKNLKERVTENLEKIEASKNALGYLHNELAYTEIKFLNRSHIHDLSFTVMAWIYFYQDDSVQEILQLKDGALMVSRLIEHIIGGFGIEVRKIKNLVYEMEEFLKEVDNLHKNFLEYESQSQIDISFFV